MTEFDARFEDANDEPLRLKVNDSDDLVVVSALIQDAVFAADDAHWDRQRREFSMLLNRFRWEHRAKADDFERVRSVLMVKDAMNVLSDIVRGGGAPAAYSLLSIGFAPGEDGTGTVTLTLSGDREISVEVECLDASLTDVTRPYGAISRSRPGHGSS